MKQHDNKQQLPSGIFAMQAVHNLKSILNGFENGVFCVAEDIPQAQLAEIRREISLMFDTVARAYAEVGKPELMNVPGIGHFEREAQPEGEK